MLALVSIAVLQLSDVDRSLEPPLVVAEQPQAAATVVPEVRTFATFVGRHLLVVDADARGFSVRQNERLFHLADDDIAAAFAMVPEARALALQAQRNLRIATVLNTIGLSAAGAGSASIAFLPLLVTSAPALGVAIVAALLIAGAGLVASLIAAPFMMTAQAQFVSAVAVYNRALLEPERSPLALSAPTEPGR
jgi:hypothetical protein